MHEPAILFMSLRSILTGAALTVAGIAFSPAEASPIRYDVTFSNAPTGSFDYDPVSQSFSNFLVTWDAVTMDLTASANTGAGLVSGSPISGTCDVGNAAVLSFDILTQAPCLAAIPRLYSYGAYAYHGGVEPSIVLNILIFQPPFQIVAGSFYGNSLTPGAGNDLDFGTYLVTQAANGAPAPSPVALIGIALVSLLWARSMTRGRSAKRRGA